MLVHGGLFFACLKFVSKVLTLTFCRKALRLISNESLLKALNCTQTEQTVRFKNLTLISRLKSKVLRFRQRIPDVRANGLKTSNATSFSRWFWMRFFHEQSQLPTC